MESKIGREDKKGSALKYVLTRPPSPQCGLNKVPTKLTKEATTPMLKVVIESLFHLIRKEGSYS